MLRYKPPKLSLALHGGKTTRLYLGLGPTFRCIGNNKLLHIKVSRKNVTSLDILFKTKRVYVRPC